MFMTFVSNAVFENVQFSVHYKTLSFQDDQWTTISLTPTEFKLLISIDANAGAAMRPSAATGVLSRRHGAS